jgi:nitrate/TMAO reductase-like tetraheme cytochrome c subunit
VLSDDLGQCTTRALGSPCASLATRGHVHIGITGFIALAASAVAASIIIGYLVKRPALDLVVKLWLLVGLGVLPGIVAASSTVSNMERTTERSFCGSCHVMEAHYGDASDPASQSLAARHSRNPFFGKESCYVCHADYGTFGYALTKLGGMRHVYKYYLGGYDRMTLEHAEQVIHLVKPYDNANCRQCHSTTADVWQRVPDHSSLRKELENNKVSCASAGCHGYAHPFTKSVAVGLSPNAGTRAP